MYDDVRGVGRFVSSEPSPIKPPLELIAPEDVIVVVNIPSDPPVPDDISPVLDTAKLDAIIVNSSVPTSIFKGLLPFK